MYLPHPDYPIEYDPPQGANPAAVRPQGPIR
jgi:hypothetical protein